MTRPRLRPIVVAAGIAVLAPLPAVPAGAAPHQEDTEARVLDLAHRVPELEYRVFDLTYRTGAVDKSERVEETPEQTSVVLSADVLFEFDRADLTDAAGTRLDDLADDLDDLGPREVDIGGHTDSRGDPAYNQDLSIRRARAVETALADRLDGDFTFTVNGHGESDPVAPNEKDDGSDNPEGRTLNRRVEITYPS